MKKSSAGNRHGVKLSKERLETVTELLGLDITALIRGEVDSYLTEVLQLHLSLLMNTEVQEKAGRRYERDDERSCVRWGTQDSSAYVLGQRIPIEKPRLRTVDGRAEVYLDSAKLLTDPKALNEDTAQKLLIGVSTRRYADTIEGLLQERGVGRQTISRRGIEVMAQRLEEFQKRDFSHLDIVAILIDGIHIADTVHIVAVGIDINGKKHVLGMKPGETEDHVVCSALMADLIERGLSEAGGYLFVVDGSKALRKAILAVFGKRIAIQRCLEHKKRNLESYVPKSRHQEIRHKMEAAFAHEMHEDAVKAFDLLRRELSLIRASAEKSLLDGLGELLTLHKLEVSGALRRSLSTTNCIESIFSTGRYYTRNVKRWRKEDDSQRWLAAGLLEAEKNLRPLKGYTNLKKLKQNLLKLTKAK